MPAFPRPLPSLSSRPRLHHLLQPARRASVFAALLIAPGLGAQTTLYWPGGAGAWDTTAAAWSTTANGLAPLQAWSNAAFDRATFGLGAGTVTLAAPISAGSLTFTTDGYTLTGGTLTLVAAGSVDTGSGTQTISSILAGAGTSFTKSGSGTLLLTGANTYTGTTTIGAGTLKISGSGASIGAASASASTMSVGSTADATLRIDSGASLKNTSATLGSASGTKGSVVVDGTGSLWNITNTSGTTLSIASGGNGALTVSNGGTVTLARPGSFSTTAGHTGDLLVDGTGSTFTSTTLNMQGAGTGTLTVSNGGAISSSNASLGNSSGTGGTVTALVTGAGSKWNINTGSTSSLAMYGGTSLTIADGGAVNVGWSVYLGDTTSSLAKITVGGNSATLNVLNAAFAVGDTGQGTLEVNDGGIVNAGYNFRIGNADAATGIVNQNGGTVTVSRYIEFFKGRAEYHLLGGTLAVGNDSGVDGIYTPSATSYIFELGGGRLQVYGSALTVDANITTKTGTTSTLDTPGSASQFMAIAGTISGSGALLKTGAGGLYLNGANSAFSGGLTLQQGLVNPFLNTSLGTGTLTFSGNATLQIDAANLSYSNSVTLNSGIAGTIDVASGKTATLSGAITGGGALTKTSAGTLVLSGANNYTGATTISGGTLQFANAGALYHGDSASWTGANLTVQSGATAAFSVGGVSGFTAANVDTLLANLGTGSGGFQSGSSIGFDTTNAVGNFSLNSPLGNLNGGAISLGLAKLGSGTLTLTGANTYTGGTTVTGGTLALASGATLATGALMAGGGTLDLGGATQAFTTVTLAGGTIQNGTFSAASLAAQSGTIDARLTGSAALTKTTSGTVTLTGANTFTGQTAIQAGTLSINSIGNVGGAASALGTPTTVSAGTLKIGSTTSTGTLNYSGSGDTTDRVVDLAGTTGGATLNASGSGALVFTSNFTASGNGNKTLALTGTGTAANAIQGAIVNGATGATSISKTGAGSWTLSGSSTFTGNVAVSAGTLRATTNATALGTGASALTLSGTGALQLAGDSGLNFGRNTTVSASTANFTSDRLTTGAGVTHTLGTLSIGAQTLALNKGANVISGTAGLTFGNVTVSGNSTFSAGGGTLLTLGAIAPSSGTRNLTFAGAGDTAVTGAITTSAGTLTKSGTGTLTLSGANTYTGITTVSGGTLQLAKANSLLAANWTAAKFIVNSGATAAFNVGGTNEFTAANIATLAALGGGSNGFRSGSILGLDTTNATGGVFTYNSALANPNSGSNTLGLVKLGSGTLILGGANTYTGATSVNAGTLRVNGTATSSAFTINSGGALGGHGAVGALTIASGGTLAPGNSPGTLTAGNTTFAGGGTFQFELNDTTGAAGTNYDLLAISGTLTLNATSANPFNLDLTSLTSGNLPGLAANFDSAADYSFTFLSTTGGITGFAADAFAISMTNFQNPFAGTWSVSLTNSGHDLSLSYAGVSAIPEPSTYAMLAGLAALALATVRRRARAAA